MGAVPENRIKNAPAARRAAAKKAAAVKVQAEAVAVQAAKPPGAYVLLGETQSLAAGTAEHDWGWKPGKVKSTWIDDAGNTVRYVANMTSLVALTKKSAPVLVYEGYRWYAAIAPHHLQKLVAEGLVVVHRPVPMPKV